MAKGASIRHGGPTQSELAKILRNIGYRHNLFQVWRDFVACSALAISNAVDPRCYAEREAEYMTIANRYNSDELSGFSQCLAILAMGMEAGPDDLLGSLFMTLDLGNEWHGQFFTPYAVCSLMAGINLAGSGPDKAIAEKGFITVNDPCVGGGAMLIAFADAMAKAGMNYQQQLHAVGQDIDIVACHMAYIQLSLLHVPAVVIHGNSLLAEERSAWRTPAHMLGGWGDRLRQWEANQAQPPVPDALQPTPEVFVPTEEALRAANDPERVRRHARVSQYSLF